MAGVAVLALAGCSQGLPQVSSIAPDYASLLQPDLYAALTDDDIEIAVAAMQDALEAGRNGAETAWINRRTGHRGVLVPQSRDWVDEATLCRDYRETLFVGGLSATYRNTACRYEEGVWLWVGQR
jgi:surface antigen